MRVFNNNELAMARNIAVARSLTLSTTLKQLNAFYGVQQWEDRIPARYRVDGATVNHKPAVINFGKVNSRTEATYFEGEPTKGSITKQANADRWFEGAVSNICALTPAEHAARDADLAAGNLPF